MRPRKRSLDTLNVMPSTLLLLRHGHTAYNTGAAPERLRGWLDVPLDEEGKRDAQRLAKVLSTKPVTAIVTSDLKRATVTADAIASATGAPVTRTRALRPWNLGEFAGRPVEPSLSFLKYYQNHPYLKVTGGEPYADFYNRWQKALASLLEAAEGADSGWIVGMTHGRNLLATPSILTGGKASIDPKEGPSTAEGYLITKDGGGWVLQDWQAGGTDGEQPAVAQGEGDDEKLDPAVVLYFPPEQIGDYRGARCGICMMYVAKHCTVVAGDINPDVGICGLYVNGKHSGPDMRGTMPKKIAGYVEQGPTHCGNCDYYGGDKTTGPCEKVRGTVAYHGCCNFWESKD